MPFGPHRGPFTAIAALAPLPGLFPPVLRPLPGRFTMERWCRLPGDKAYCSLVSDPVGLAPDLTSDRYSLSINPCKWCAARRKKFMAQDDGTAEESAPAPTSALANALHLIGLP